MNINVIKNTNTIEIKCKSKEEVKWVLESLQKGFEHDIVEIRESLGIGVKEKIENK